MCTLVCAVLQSILHLTSTRTLTHAHCAKTAIPSWPSGGRREQLWRLQCDEGHGRETHRRPVSTAESLAVTKYCVRRLGSRRVSKLIPEVCEDICLCSFSSATLWIDTPPRQRFHLVDKLITAREFNEFSTCGYKNPLGACTVRSYYSDASHALYAVPRVRIQSEVYFGL